MGILDRLFSRPVSWDQLEEVGPPWVGTEEEWRMSVELASMVEENEIQQEINETLLPANPHESSNDDSSTTHVGRAGSVLVSYDYSWRRR